MRYSGRGQGRGRGTLLGSTLLLTLGMAVVAHAQDTGGMAQGEAMINVRSDVKLGIKGTRGTTSERLQQLGKALTSQMPDIRACYAKLVAKSPTTVGGLRATIALERGKPGVQLELEEREGTAKQLTRCVRKAIKRMSVKDVGRPAAAIATLSFQNSRAEGQKLVGKLTSEKDVVDVKTGADGRKTASWATDGGKIRFIVSAKAGAERATVEGAVRGLRNGFAGLMDCRRRARKLGLSPAGRTDVLLRLRRKGKAGVKVRGTTVAHKRAPICVERALSRIVFPEVPRPGRLDLAVEFED